MSAANVRCAGGGLAGGIDRVYHDQMPSTHTKPYTRADLSRPCGWKGKRKNDRDYYGPHGMEPAATIEPCPRCSGRVELIQRG